MSSGLKRRAGTIISARWWCVWGAGPCRTRRRATGGATGGGVGPSIAREFGLPGGAAMALAPTAGEIALFSRQARYRTQAARDLIGFSAEIGLKQRDWRAACLRRRRSAAPRAPAGGTTPAAIDRRNRFREGDDFRIGGVEAESAGGRARRLAKPMSTAASCSLLLTTIR